MIADVKYSEPRAHALRERYLERFGGAEIPVPVKEIAEDLLGLRVERSSEIEHSGVLLPSTRRILLNATEMPRDVARLRRFRFTIAHEVAHWVCHVVSATGAEPVYCRAKDLEEGADRTLEREANVFAAELLMPEPAVRAAWAELCEIEACAALFDVSPTAMHWRLYSYGLASRPLA